MNILTYPNPDLFRRAEPVKAIDKDIRSLVKEMIITLDEIQGVGLAAPQVGRNIRLIVYNHDDQYHTLINPKITSSDGLTLNYEWCLSIPHMGAYKERYKNVTVEGFNLEARGIKIEAEPPLSFILQHEIDHLHGIMIAKETK